MGRPDSNPDWSPHKKRIFGNRDVQAEERSGEEDTARRQPSVSQRRRPQKESNMPTP